MITCAQKGGVFPYKSRYQALLYEATQDQRGKVYFSFHTVCKYAVFDPKVFNNFHKCAILSL